ncbi:MAG: phosphoglycerate dehydrogenase [Gemmatimonadetes bacterium]|nr:phosphoglycerate dehydrogenase [Gemmatimonadota bacterium]
MAYRILITDQVDREGVALLEAEPDLVVEEVPTLPVPELLERIPDYDAIIGRSATRITRELLEKGRRLRVVGRAGVGVDNIDLAAATALGIAVINAPAGNTVAVAELFYGAMISLLRHLPRAATSMREGRWDRSKLLGSELRGRTLGIVGVGRIGGEVATRAHAFGVDVVGYDPYVPESRFEVLRARRAPTLDALLEQSDIVTIHTPLTDETRGMIGRREIGRMRPGAILVNMARGGIVDDAALLDALHSGHLGGAVLDVFSTEPLPADHPLRSAPNVFLSPHIGASTAEAQRNVAVEVCEAVRDALLTGDFSRAVNVAAVEGPWHDPWRALRPIMGVTRRAAAVARAILADQGVTAVQRLTLRCAPELAGGREALLAAAALGALEDVVETERLNLINARTLAEARGMELAVGESAQLPPSTVEVSLRGAMQELTVAGTATVGAAPRLTRIGAFRVDVNVGGGPRPTLIVLTNRDVPGVIGRVGTVLGDAGVNIAEYHQARLSEGGEALAAIAVDGKADAALRQKLLAIPDVKSATIVCFADA